MRLALFMSVAFSIAALVSWPAVAAQDVLVVNAGDPFGVYFERAGMFCARYEEMPGPGPAQCAVRPSAGSVANIEALRAGEADLALVQSDAGFLDMVGAGPLKRPGDAPALQVIGPVFREALMVVARRDASIETIQDLKGKRVAVGPLKSGTRTLFDLVLEWHGFDESAFYAVTVQPSAYRALICAGEIDAAIQVAAHPNRSMAPLIGECGAVPVALSQDARETLSVAYPFIGLETIAATAYGTQAPVPTVGVNAMAVARPGLDPDVVGRARAVIEALIAEAAGVAPGP